ncbi:DUF6575 domain-containing protein [Deinococcus rufus]|uniref:DUF6575 domain-containing protein n=1 Tax=Deinococcus rufus TaxID=2136097 RepID=A0ABV7Z9Z3_9DEIO
MTGTFTPAFGHLETVTVYITVNEPMLFSARNELGELFIVGYADMTENGEMWMIVRVSRGRLRQFEAGQIDIRDMFLQPELGSVTLVEYDDTHPDRPGLRYLLPSDPELLEYVASPGRKVPHVMPQPSAPAEVAVTLREYFSINRTRPAFWIASGIVRSSRGIGGSEEDITIDVPARSTLDLSGYHA